MIRIGQGARRRRSPGRALLRRWPFLLVCTILGTLLSGVVLLARGPIYEAQATVHYDPERYGFTTAGEAGTLTLHPLLAEEAEALLSLNSPGDLHSSPRIGRPVAFEVVEQGTLAVLGRASEAGRAREIADHGGTALAESMRSIYGWNLLRTLLRRTIYLQGQGQPEPDTVLTPHLFDLLEAGFLAYDPSIPITAEAPTLSAQDVADVTLAIQRTEELQRQHIDSLFGQMERSEDAAERAQLEQEIATLTWKQDRLRETLITLYRQGDTLVATSDHPTPPQVNSPAVPPETPAGLARWPLLFVGAGAGLLFAAVVALADEGLNLSRRLRDVVAYRDLVWNLVLRDLKGRYKSSVLGYLWSLVNPLLMMIVFTVLFKYLLKSAIPNFPVFVIVALLPWNYCATAVSGAVVSITGQSDLIKKVYFPREAIPISIVLANMINFFLALPAMILIMVLLNAHFQWVVLLFPVIASIQTIFLLGVSFFLSSVNVFFRDTQVIMDVFLTAWFFLTPVFYRLDDIVDERLARLVRWVNPMASLLDFYRDIFYLGGMPGWDAIVRTFVTALVVFAVGYLFFLRLSPHFGEEV